MAATNGLDWLTNPSSELFQEKEAAPGYQIPEGLTAKTVSDADDLNGLHNASKAMRMALLTPFVAEYQPFENYLKNTQWQLLTNCGYGPKYKADGTGVEAAITVTSHTTATNTPICSTANTGNLKANDLVEFSVAAVTNLKICPARVNSVSANVSFAVGIPRGLTPGTSAACTAQPVDAGGTASAAGTDAADGWTKPVGPEVWRDDNAVNLKEGSRYSLAYKKSSADRQDLTHPIEAKDLQKFLGKDVVFGVGVKHGIKGGAGTWRAVITINGSDTTSAAADAIVFQWREVTATVPADATSVSFGVAFEGDSGDVYYVSQPMAGAGNALGPWNYSQARGETFDALRSVPLAPYQSATIAFPSPQLNASTSGMALSDDTALGGSVGTDWAIRSRMNAETYGKVANTVRGVKLQMRARSATTTRSRINSFWPIRVHCQVGGTRGTATFKISANSAGTGFLSFSSVQASVVGTATMSWPSGTYSGDANNIYVKNQVINVGNGGTYVAGDTWDFTVNGGAPTFTGSGYNGITITAVTQNAQWGIRDRNVVDPTPVELQFYEAKVAGALESQTTWVQPEANGDFFLYASSMALPLTECTLTLNGFILA